MTRAFNELFQLHFKEAYALNPKIVLVAPLMVYIWIKTLVREVQKKERGLSCNNKETM